MKQERWSEVDRYITERLVGSDAILAATLRANAAAGLPAHDVSPNQGKFLQLLVQIHGSRNVLEIGTLGGFSTIWFARVLPQNGAVVTIESDPRHAEVARSNIQRAGLGDVVDLRMGRALDVLPRLEAEGRTPFDLIFIDADKALNPEYLDWAIRLSRAGSVIVADNVVRGGAIVDADADDPNVLGVRRFYESLGADRRVAATALQTVGGKGYDGFAIAVVLAETRNGQTGRSRP